MNSFQQNQSVVPVEWASWIWEFCVYSNSRRRICNNAVENKFNLSRYFTPVDIFVNSGIQIDNSELFR